MSELVTLPQLLNGITGVVDSMRASLNERDRHVERIREDMKEFDEISRSRVFSAVTELRTALIIENRENYASLLRQLRPWLIGLGVLLLIQNLLLLSLWLKR